MIDDYSLFVECVVSMVCFGGGWGRFGKASGTFFLFFQFFFFLRIKGRKVEGRKIERYLPQRSQVSSEQEYRRIPCADLRLHPC